LPILLAWPLAAAAASVSFRRVPGDFFAGTRPVAITTGDFNGDGNLDVAAANNDSGDVSVLLGQGDGTLIDAGTTFRIGTPDLAAPAALAVGDFNGDGKPDVVVADEIGNTVSVLLNSGTTPLFDASINSNAGTSPEAVVVADFNGDGKLDVATADNLDDTATVLLGTGDGHFVPPSFCSTQPAQPCRQNSECPDGGTCDARSALSSGAAPTALVAVDLDGDGKLDLVVANSAGNPQTTSGSLIVFKGLGDGTFAAQPETLSPTFDVPVAIAAADLNGDGKPDLVVVNEQSDTVSVLLGNGDLSFQTAMSSSVAALPEAVALADFDGDGILDIAVAASFDDKVSVLTGVGDGRFTTALGFSVGTAPAGLAAADLNRDGKPDLISANSENDTLRCC